MLTETANKAIALQCSSQQIEQWSWQGEQGREQAATAADSLGLGLLLSIYDQIKQLQEQYLKNTAL